MNNEKGLTKLSWDFCSSLYWVDQNRTHMIGSDNAPLQNDANPDEEMQAATNIIKVNIQFSTNIIKVENGVLWCVKV